MRNIAPEKKRHTGIDILYIGKRPTRRLCSIDEIREYCNYPGHQKHVSEMGVGYREAQTPNWNHGLRVGSIKIYGKIAL